MTPQSNPPGGQHTTAVLHYYQIPPGEEDERLPRTRNLRYAEFSPRRCIVTDIRGQEQNWNFVDNGFQLLKTSPTAEQSDIEDQVLKITGGRNVAIYDTQYIKDNDCKPPGRISPTVKIENTVESARFQIGQHFPENQAEIIGNGYILLDAWRPLAVATSSKFAFMDTAPRHSSMIDEDLIPMQNFSDQRPTGDMYCLKHGDGWDGPDRHHWYYLSGQSRDEVIIVRVAEGRKGMARAAGTPRAFFDDSASIDPVSPMWQQVRMLVRF